eukprot:CAMPEP_0182457854 /NCGR_PEP_ID=MMETSP1319-20130603/3320_1 /TAXON_ID=172717 /ORGANISM="Bolidomonas pacifica, Strain RCC208" /LENGTH=204 /DNA_ID=CAMNT_0024656399 /DNA_START=105 /DNA_END=715 /DNA_ORIENTATION=+
MSSFTPDQLRERSELFSKFSATQDSPPHLGPLPPPRETSSFRDPPASVSLQESLETASATAAALDRQNDSLQNSLEHVRSEEYFLSKGDRLLRGMGSWSGWAYNTFVKSEKSELRGIGAGGRRSSGVGGGAPPRAAPLEYGGGDPVCTEAVTLLRSYEANAELLSAAGSTPEQRGALREVCEGIAGRLRRMEARDANTEERRRG